MHNFNLHENTNINSLNLKGGLFMLVIKIIGAALLSILVMLLISKLLGNKQISELNMFDYINGITIGSIAAEMSVSQEAEEIFIALIAMLVYGIVVFAISMATVKSIKCRRFFAGRTLLLIENGKIYSENLKKSKLDVNDLLTKARTNGYFDISQINYAIMENNGEISFFPYSEYRPVNACDLNIEPRPQPEYLNLNIIIDGNIMHQNLKYCGVDEAWLKKELSARGKKAKDIFLATLDQTNTLHIYDFQKEKNLKNIFD